MLAVPILILGGRTWDLSNLCPNGRAHLSPTLSKHSRRCSRKRHAMPEASLYPSLDVLDSPVWDVEPASEVFRRLSLSSNDSSSEEASPTREQKRSNSHKEAHITPEYFPSRRTSLYPSLDEIENQEPSSEVFQRAASLRSNSPEEGRRTRESCRKSARSNSSRKSHSKLSISPKEARAVPASKPGTVHSRPTPTISPVAFTPTSDAPLKATSNPRPPPAWMDQNQADAEQNVRRMSVNENSYAPSAHSLQPEASSRSCLGYHGEEDDEEEHHPRRGSKVVQVEVAPGQYMPLRGSVETLQAVESGKASLVSCFACKATLWCVPDADLVLCPDCRIFSPLSSKQSSPSWNRVGGVGLGAKVDLES